MAPADSRMVQIRQYQTEHVGRSQFALQGGSAWRGALGMKQKACRYMQKKKKFSSTLERNLKSLSDDNVCAIRDTCMTSTRVVVVRNGSSDICMRPARNGLRCRPGSQPLRHPACRGVYCARMCVVADDAGGDVPSLTMVLTTLLRVNHGRVRWKC